MHDAWLRPARISHFHNYFKTRRLFINRLRPIECKLSNKTGKSCRLFRITSISLSFNFTLLHIHLIPFSLPFIVQYSFLFPFLILYFSLCLSPFFFLFMFLCVFSYFHSYAYYFLLFSHLFIFPPSLSLPFHCKLILYFIFSFSYFHS